MPKSSQAPATKADIKMLMGEIGKLYDANKRWKGELIAEMNKKVSSSEKRVKHHFDLTVEIIRADLTGANKDKIESHETRIRRLEAHVGLTA